MISFVQALLIVAVIFWIFATFNLFSNPPRVNWWYAGWLMLLIAFIVYKFPLHFGSG